MKRTIIFVVGFILIGFILGYLIFGRISGEYMPLEAIFTKSDNVLEKIGRSLSGLREIKQNILISGGVGGIVGLVISLVKK